MRLGVTGVDPGGLVGLGSNRVARWGWVGLGWAGVDPGSWVRLGGAGVDPGGWVGLGSGKARSWRTLALPESEGRWPYACSQHIQGCQDGSSSAQWIKCGDSHAGATGIFQGDQLRTDAYSRDVGSARPINPVFGVASHTPPSPGTEVAPHRHRKQRQGVGDEQGGRRGDLGSGEGRGQGVVGCGSPTALSRHLSLSGTRGRGVGF